MLAWHVHDDRSIAVQPAGGVFTDFTCVPCGAVERFPLQRRIVGIDADAFDGAVELQAHRALRHGVAQTDQQRVARVRRAAERSKRDSQPQLVGSRLAALRGRSVGEDRAEGAGDDRQVFDSGEHDRLLCFGAQRRCARAAWQRQGRLRRRRQIERHSRSRRSCREQLQPDQFEELEVQTVGHAVEAVQQHVGHVGERLDQCHARVRHVVIGPCRAAGHDHSLGVVDQLLEAPVVEIWCWQCHQ